MNENMYSGKGQNKLNQASYRKTGVVKISIFITSIFVICISVAYAFINQTLTGTKRQVITSGNLQLSLEEKNEVSLINALPMYDEVGMIQTPFKFFLTNKSSEPVDYIIKLEDVTEVTDKLSPSIVKYGLEKDEIRKIGFISDLTDSIIDEGMVKGNQKVEYTLRLWIDSSVEDESIIKDKILSYKLKIEGIRKPTEQKIFLATMKQGDYVAYVGNNGCQNNGVDITGDSDAESKNSCLGWNANQLDTDTSSFGYCYNSAFKYTTSGWRIAYIEDERAYLISAGSPECNTRPISTRNLSYMQLANEKARKYCNSSFVDGDCNDDNDSFAIRDKDFYKMTSVMNNGEGRHLTLYYGASHCCNNSNSLCGLNNDLFENGGYYWFSTVHSSSTNYGISWSVINRRVNTSSSSDALGLRPIIRLSPSVYVTGGEGTMENPYQIAND